MQCPQSHINEVKGFYQVLMRCYILNVCIFQVIERNM